MSGFQERWDALMRALRVDPAAEPARRWGAYVVAAYAEPTRAYHNAAHVTALLDRLEAWADRAEDLPALRLAAFFHDAVYEGRPGKDERASADLVDAAGPELGLSASRIERIVRWILATAGHGAQAENDAQLFLDADLEILSAEDAGYDAYAAAIRQEYAHVPDAIFRDGRRRVLESLLARPALYQHPRTPAFWESRARANLTRELSRL